MSVLNGQVEVFDQHAGDALQLRVFGDEFYARFETLEGFSVVYDVDLGVYCYVQLAGDGRFVSTGVPVGKPVPTGLRRHLKEAPEVRNRRFSQRYMQLRPPEPEPDSAIIRTFGPDGGLLDGRKLFSGDVTGLTVIVDFDDVRSNITPADVDAMLNQDGYRVNGNFSSVREYFRTVSNGKLNYRNRVVGPVRLSKRRAEYISTLMVEEVMDIVVNDLGIDLAEFDSRGDGIVDALNILYAGNSQYTGNLWPHNSVADLRYGGMRTHFYLLTGLGRERVDLRIGTLCHENGHLLCRFPDMYDYGKRDGDAEQSAGIGIYCLMGAGNHLDSRRTPAPVCAYLRYLAGWADNVVLLNNTGEFEASHGDYGSVLKYETDDLNEYFLVENRTNIGLDKGLPASGLAVYHCDTLGSNEWQGGSESRHYQCALLQADGHLDLENNRNQGDADDLFAACDGVALAHDTTPSSRVWSGSDSGLTIADVGAPGDVIRFRVGQAPGGSSGSRTRAEAFPNLLIPDNEPAGVDSSLSIAEDGNLAAIAVDVAIIHSWIGDLVVSLIAPDGSEAVLHDKAGASGDDIHRRFDDADTPALQRLIGSGVRGAWRLHVVDTASRDVGVLESWTLEIDVERAHQVVQGEAAPGMSIPDDDAAGISSGIRLDGGGVITDIQVEVDISHTYIGDLQVDLVSPAATLIRLHANEGGGRSDLKRRYESAMFTALQVLEGEAVAGDWMLRVRDLAARDVGTLNRWSVRVAY